MQLYSLSFSPYASRCRIYIHHKNLPVAIVAPPGGLGSAQLKAKNPIGKIPVLDLGERAIAESWTIMEYLESQHPAQPMWPADEFGRPRIGKDGTVMTERFYGDVLIQAPAWVRAECDERIAGQATPALHPNLWPFP